MSAITARWFHDVADVDGDDAVACTYTRGRRHTYYLVHVHVHVHDCSAAEQKDAPGWFGCRPNYWLPEIANRITTPQHRSSPRATNEKLFRDRIMAARELPRPPDLMRIRPDLMRTRQQSIPSQRTPAISAASSPRTWSQPIPMRGVHITPFGTQTPALSMSSPRQVASPRLPSPFRQQPFTQPLHTCQFSTLAKPTTVLRDGLFPLRGGRTFQPIRPSTAVSLTVSPRTQVHTAGHAQRSYIRPRTPAYNATVYDASWPIATTGFFGPLH